MEKTLNLIFEDAAKVRTTISLDSPKNDLTKEKILEATQAMLASGALVSSKGLALTKIAAANVTTKTVEAFEVA